MGIYDAIGENHANPHLGEDNQGRSRADEERPEQTNNMKKTPPMAGLSFVKLVPVLR